jgi:hypothetical protein
VNRGLRILAQSPAADPVPEGARLYFEAAALGNGKPRRFALLVKNLRGGFIALHFLVIALALNFPVMFAIARLEPWELYSRLYGPAFGEMLQGEPGAPAAGDFNDALYAGGYGRRIMLPILAFTFALVLILQAAFYFLASFFLGLARMTGTPLSLRERFGLLIFSSTMPAAAAAFFGLWLPAVHLVVFYLGETILAFALSRTWDEGQTGT